MEMFATNELDPSPVEAEEMRLLHDALETTGSLLPESTVWSESSISELLLIAQGAKVVMERQLSNLWLVTLLSETLPRDEKMDTYVHTNVFRRQAAPERYITLGGIITLWGLSKDSRELRHDGSFESFQFGPIDAAKALYAGRSVS